MQTQIEQHQDVKQDLYAGQQEVQKLEGSHAVNGRPAGRHQFLGSNTSGVTTPQAYA